MRLLWSCLFVGWVITTSMANGQAKRPAPIDPTKKDEDFAVQGEYVGVIMEDGKAQPIPTGVRIEIDQTNFVDRYLFVGTD